MNKLLIILLLMSATSGCNSSSQQPDASGFSDAQPSAYGVGEHDIVSASPTPSATAPAALSWADRAWLESASRALRGGDSLSADEDPQVLLSQGRAHVVQQFVDDPRFADSILGFNLDVLGFRQDRVKKENGNYEDIIYELPHAITSAKAILNPAGDYFSLFDLQHPFYIGPLLRPANEAAYPGDALLDPATLRQQVFQRIQGDLDSIIALAQTSATNTSAACTALNAHVSGFVFSNVYNLPPTLARSVMYSPNWYQNAYLFCRGSTVPNFDLLSNLQTIKVQNAKFYAKLAAFDPSSYKTGDLNAIQTIDFLDMGISFVQNPFTETIQNTLLNSSTNYDRKRSAYILKRFFCDDLTPVNVEAPAQHAGTQHASDASCMACHYKLDPMAGFFRDLGVQFRDFSQNSKIYFDDGASVLRSTYDTEWQPGPDATHPWNVGYIRSTQDLTKNSYGSTITDLYGLLKTAPEVKRCIMQRMFGYLVSDEQTVDGGYLDYLTQGFTSDIAQNGSVAAVKNAASKIVLSQSFAQLNPDFNSCYDYAPGSTPSSSTPCKIASTLQQSCVHCHNSTDRSPFLDLSKWELQADGKMGFPHLTGTGTAINAGTTFQNILDRISSTDPDERMPLMSDMPASSRETLFTWVNTQL